MIVVERSARKMDPTRKIVGEKLIQACKSGDIEQIRRLVREGANPSQDVDADWPYLYDSPLIHEVCRYVIEMRISLYTHRQPKGLSYL